MNRIKFETIESTNTWALENIEELADRTVITAETQTMGRGRFSRKWRSESNENLYLSFVLKPKKLDATPNLTQYLALCLTKVLGLYGVSANIKWPNDVQVEGKKIAGILCESSIKGTDIKGFVLGAGVNLNMSTHQIEKIDIPATSLNLIKNAKIDKEEFLNFLIEIFFEDYEKFIENGFSSIKDDFKSKIKFLGQRIKISDYNGSKTEYTALDIASDGCLLVRDDNGQKKIILSGDVLPVNDDFARGHDVY